MENSVDSRASDYCIVVVVVRCQYFDQHTQNYRYYGAFSGLPCRYGKPDFSGLNWLFPVL